MKLKKIKTKINKMFNKYRKLSITKKTIIWFTLAVIIQKGITFITTPIITRILSAEEYGVYNLYSSWLQIFAIITVLALDRCIVVGFMKFEKNREDFLAAVQILMSVLILIWTLIIYIFQDFFVNSLNLSTAMIITILMMSLMNNVMSNWAWMQRYKNNYIKMSIMTIGSVLITQLIGILAVTTANFNDKAIVLILVITAVKLIFSIYIYIDVLIRAKKIFKLEYFKFALRYSVVIVPHALSQIILTSSDRIIIDYFGSKEEVAFYGIVYSASSVLTIILTSISTAVQPWYYECIKEKQFLEIKNKTNIVLLVSGVIVLSSTLIAPEIIGILAPSNYSVAVWVFPPIAASVFFNSMFLYFANFESYYEKSSYFSIATSVGAIINIVLNIILIPKFGFIAAGYTTLLSYIIYAYMHYLFMRKICKDKLDNINVFDSKNILLMSIIVIAISLFIVILYNYTIIRYLIIILLIVIIIGKIQTIKKFVSKLLAK